jgi:lipoate-protein ligase A
MDADPERWRLITTWGADPAFNMGLDEALLESDESPPTLRFYSWRPDTLSLGYFQKLADVPAANGSADAAARKPGTIVRRITGGGAIHHVRELTFSITAPLAHRLYAGSIAASYARVHAAIASALSEVGVIAAPRGSSVLASDVEGTGMCFHHSTELDLAWGAKKGVGSAQRRRGGRVLHHGSIKLGSSPLEGAIATVGDVAPKMSCETFAPILRAAIERVLAIELEADVPTKGERQRAHELGHRYVDPEFVRRR